MPPRPPPVFLLPRSLRRCPHRRSSDSVSHSWPPTNRLTPLLLALMRDSLNSSFAASSPPGRAFPVIVDMTFGSGSHSTAALKEFDDERLLLFAADRDPAAVRAAAELAKRETRKVVPIKAKFSECLTEFQSYVSHPGFADVVLLDAGISSLQEKDPSRGFSVLRGISSPLDLRMDADSADASIPSTLAAADVLFHLPQQQLTELFKKYGDERNAKSLAAALFDAKYAFGKIETTVDLEAVTSGIAFKDHHSDAENAARGKKIAQNALRVLRYFINDELNELHAGIEAAYVLLKPNGLLLFSSEEKALNQVAKNSLDAFQGPIRAIETERSVGVGVEKMFFLEQGRRNPGKIYDRATVESLLHRKWKKVRKELVVEDEGSGTTLVRAVVKNVLEDIDIEGFEERNS